MLSCSFIHFQQAGQFLEFDFARASIAGATPARRIRAGEFTSVETCAQLCLRDPNCKSFEAGSGGRAGECYTSQHNIAETKSVQLVASPFGEVDHYELGESYRLCDEGTVCSWGPCGKGMVSMTGKCAHVCMCVSVRARERTTMHTSLATALWCTRGILAVSLCSFCLFAETALLDDVMAVQDGIPTGAKRAQPTHTAMLQSAQSAQHAPQGNIRSRPERRHVMVVWMQAALLVQQVQMRTATVRSVEIPLSNR